jgi:hypothetical protein
MFFPRPSEAFAFILFNRTRTHHEPKAKVE